jgi:hypothetical protein
VHSLGSKNSKNRFIDDLMTSGSYDNCWLFAASEITGTDGSFILMIFEK